MGKLADSFKDKFKQVVGDAVEERITQIMTDTGAETANVQVVEQKTIEDSDVDMRWTPEWLGQVCTYLGLDVTDDEEKALKILEALKRRQGYCPCTGKNIDTLCPCKRMREDNICTCGLFKSVYRREMKTSHSATIEER